MSNILYNSILTSTYLQQLVTWHEINQIYIISPLRLLYSL